MAIQANRIAFGFDSRAANGVGTSGGLTIENYDRIHHILRKSRQAVQLVDPIGDVWGVTGRTSREFLQALPGLLANSSCGIVCLFGPTNDRGSANMSAWESIDICNQITNMIVGVPGSRTGVKLLWIMDTPRGDTAFPGQGITGQQLLNMQIVRRWMAGLDDGVHVRVADGGRLIADPTSALGYAVVGSLIDGLHDSPLGAPLIATDAAAILLQMFPGQTPIPPINTVDTWHIDNNPWGVMTANPAVKNSGTAGSPATGGTGPIAQFWTGANSGTASGATRTYSYDADGVQRCVLSGVISGTAARLDILKQVSLHNAMNAMVTRYPGTTFEAFADIEIDAGASNISSLQLGIETVDPVNGTVRYWDGDKYLGTSQMSPLKDSGIWRVPRMPVTPNLTGASLLLSAYAVDNAASVALAVRVNNCYLQPTRPKYT